MKKKFLTLALAAVMAFSMSITAFAEPSSPAEYDYSIEVNGIETVDGKSAEVSYIQIIAADPETSTGYKFVNGAFDAFKAAFEEDDEQAIIEVIAAKDGNGNFTVDKTKMAVALSQVINNASDMTLVTDADYKFDPKAPGLYAVKVVDKTGKYTYSNMAAYVDFFATTTTQLVAKKSEIKVEKTDDDSNKLVAIGDVVKFTVTATIPYMDPSATDKSFEVSDEITGAEYVFVKDENNKASAYVGEEKVADETKFVLNDDKKGFTIDLSSLITADNKNAGKDVVVTYFAKVTATKVDNEAKAGHKGGSEYGSDKDKLFTGKITLTKTDGTNAITGSSAEFKVYPAVASGEGDSVVYIKAEDATALKFKYNAENKEYELSDADDASEVVKTDSSNGTVCIAGLDAGTYAFEETKAPDGYSVTSKLSGATITNVEKAEDILAFTTEMVDTKLSELPFTGGIGTTIFTVLGVVIMVAAAALYFATKKKSANK